MSGKGVVRAFIAVDISAELQQRLVELTQDLRRQMGDVPVRWVPGENMHLTLKFLGDVSLANLDVLTDILRAEAAKRKVMDISLGGIGAFPHPRRPRVIWAGVEAPQELEVLQRCIERETARIGYPPEERPFSPHITLGRVSRSASPREVRAIGDVLMSVKVGFLGVTRLEAVHLYRSELGRDGAVYSRMFSAPLIGQV